VQGVNICIDNIGGLGHMLKQMSDMDTVENSIRGNGEIAEKEEHQHHTSKTEHRRGGIRTLPFILGQPHSFSLKLDSTF